MELTSDRLQFDDVVIDLRRKKIERDGKTFRVSQELWDLLLLLLERAPDEVEHKEFSGIFKQESKDAHFKHIERLRNALGESGKENRFIKTIPRRGYVFAAMLTPNTIEESAPATNATPPQPELVRFDPGGDGHPPGISAESPGGITFVPWDRLKPELEKRLLISLGRIFGETRLSVALGEFKGRKNWVMHIQDPDEKHLGYVWLGGDPYNSWVWDGLVRVGEALDDDHHVVWQVFQRYSDGTYRRIAALDTPENRPK